MLNQQIVDYIKIQRQQGGTKETIINGLIVGGFKMEDIEEAFKSIDLDSTSVASSTIQAKKGKLFEPVVLLFPIFQVFIGVFVFFMIYACGGSSQQSNICPYLVWIPLIILFISPVFARFLLVSERKKNNYEKTYVTVNFFISALIPVVIIYLVGLKSIN